jgi:hypothetical protein
VTSELVARQEAEWQILHDQITETLDRFGKKDAFGREITGFWMTTGALGARSSKSKT